MNTEFDYQADVNNQRILEEHYRQEQERREHDRQFYVDPSNLGNENGTVEPSDRPLVLHQGSMVQFLSKIPDPNAPKPPDAPHLDDKLALGLLKSTVLQWPRDDPHPEHRVIDPSSHLGEENHKAFLHVGSVLQFPKDFHDPRGNKRGFLPPEEVVKETLPLADVEHPEHLLPSQARKQQAYLTHPHAQSGKTLSVLTPENGSLSPASKRKDVTAWPPTRSSVRDLPKVGFSSGHINPEGSAKQFIWPPPKNDQQQPMSENDDGSGENGGKGGTNWNPQSSDNILPSYRVTTITRRKLNWPPQNGTEQQREEWEMKGKRIIEFNEYIHGNTSINVPPTYRTPPGTQFYEVNYVIEE